MTDRPKISVLPTKANSALELAELVLEDCFAGKVKALLVVELDYDLAATCYWSQLDGVLRAVGMIEFLKNQIINGGEQDQF